MNIKSPEFEDNTPIPSEYTCEGKDISPEIKIEGIQKKTKSLALIMDDPDAPGGTWNHWILYNIPLIEKIEKNSVPEGAVHGNNSWGKNEYGGPCPPSGTHRYIFNLYALDSELNLKEGLSKQEIESAIKENILEKAELIGTYKKKN